MLLDLVGRMLVIKRRFICVDPLVAFNHSQLRCCAAVNGALVELVRKVADGGQRADKLVMVYLSIAASLLVSYIMFFSHRQRRRKFSIYGILDRGSAAADSGVFAGVSCRFYHGCPEVRGHVVTAPLRRAKVATAFTTVPGRASNLGTQVNEGTNRNRFVIFGSTRAAALGAERK